MTLSSSIYEIARDVADDLNYQIISSIFTGIEGTEDERKMRRAVKKTARFLHRYWDWPGLEKSFTFVSEANGLQTTEAPSDIDRLRKLAFRNETKNECFFATESLHQYDIATTNREYGLRLAGQNIFYTSPHAPGDTIKGYYITSGYVTALDGTTKTEITADTDRLPWPDEVIHLGLVWALLQRDGDQTNEDYVAFVSALNEHIADLSSPATIDMGYDNYLDDHYGWPRDGWRQE